MEYAFRPLPVWLRGLWYLFVLFLPFTRVCAVSVGFPLKAYEILGGALLVGLTAWGWRRKLGEAVAVRRPIPLFLSMYWIVFVAAVVHGVVYMRELAPEFDWAVGRYRPCLVGPTQALYLAFDGAIFIATAVVLGTGGAGLLRSTLVAFVAGAVISALYGLYQTIGYDHCGSSLPVISGTGIQLFDGKFGRASGFFHEANFLGLYLIFGLFAASWCFLVGRRPAWWGLAVFILLAATAQTYSLAASFTWGASILLLFPFCLRMWKRYAWVVAATLLAFGSSELRSSGYSTRVGGEAPALKTGLQSEDSRQEIRDQSSARRLLYVRAELKIFKDHPILGVGPGNSGFLVGQYEPTIATAQKQDKIISSNAYSTHLAETGIFGTVVFLGFLGSVGVAVTRTFRQSRSKRMRSGCGFLLVAGLAFVAYMNAYPTHLLTFLWVFLGLAAKVGRGIRR